MIFELTDTSKVRALYEGWQETIIYSCLQRVMGGIYVTDTDRPESAVACAGCFAFYAGKPDRELVAGKPEGYVIMIPQNRAWASLIEECFPSAKKITRYATKKDTRFDADALRKELTGLPEGYELREIDADLYDKCLTPPFARDFVSSFGSKEEYLKLGIGMVIIKDGNIVSGASSYTRYNEGIEIEVDTAVSERRKHLAYIACSALILKCLEEGLYPSWDAHNVHSLRLAEKLGYEFDHEYTAYETI